VGAPGGKFDSGDNGTYTVRLGAAAAPPLGQQIGQFTVASKAKARPAQGSQLRRLVFPAAAASVPQSSSAPLADDAAALAGEALRPESGPPEGGKRKNLAVAGRGTSRGSAVTSIREVAAP